MPLRRRAALVAAAVTALTASTVPAALADTTPPAATTSAPAPARADLYGGGDPTYDGVWRQSLAIRALYGSGYRPADSAVSWLLAQQCADGGWPSYRAETDKPCDPKTEDTNATAAAVVALERIEQYGKTGGATKRGRDWLLKIQNADGGWSYNPGGASDPDSTALVAGALRAKPAPQPGGKTPLDALTGFQFGCKAKAADRGSFGYPDPGGKLKPNAKATADVLNGLLDSGFVRDTYAATATPAAPDCATDPQAYGDALEPKSTAYAAADWLAAQLRAGGGHLNALTPGADKPTPDYGTTADAATALATIHPADAKTAYEWLVAHSAAWSKGNPAALAQIVVAHDVIYNAGGPTLTAAPVQQLLALGPKAAKRPPHPRYHATDKSDGGLSSSAVAWIVVGVVFVASAGFGILLAGRKRRQA